MLLTKLHIPSPGKNLVRRSRLFEKLNKGLDCKLILISAPAGFGKTTLISDWIYQYKIPTSWVSLDKGDTDPVEFLSYIIAGIQNISSTFGQGALKLLKSTNKPTNESIASLLINDMLKIDKDFLLVLDDFHLMDTNENLEIVRYFLEYIPDNVSIAIITRSDPALSLARLRSQHQLLELRSSDLGFSVNDISTLFKKLKIGISVDDAHSLEIKTDGWIAGLQLTALSIKDRTNVSKFIQDLKGDNRYIMDYLMEEVLKILSDDIVEFLLQTSILEKFSAPLCNNMLNRDDSQKIIEKLENNNLFVIPLDAERKWYRYHHLFADLLKLRFLHKQKPTREKLHIKALEWFEHHEMHELAIVHALEVRNYEKCIQLVGALAEKWWKNGLHAALLKYGDVLPDKIIKKNPEFCLYFSWILIINGEIEKAEPYLVAAESIVKKGTGDKKSSQESIQYYKTLLGKISVAFAYLNSNLGQSEKIFDYCSIAMENLSEEDPLWYSWAWFSYGIAHFSNGELLESEKAFNSAFAYARKSGNIYLMSTIVIRMAENEQQLGNYTSAYKKCADMLALIDDKGYSQFTKVEWTYAPLYLIMGVTQLGWANLDMAYENIKTAYNLSKKGKDSFLKIYASIIYSAILIFLEEPESERVINELDNLMKHNTVPPFLDSYYLSWKVYLLLDKDEIQQANELIADYGLGLKKKKNHANEIAYSAYARLLLKQHRLNEAEALLSELYACASSYNGTDRMIDLKTSFTQLYTLKGENDKAVACLIEAMEMASREDQVFDILFWSDSIKGVLKEVYKIQATTKTNIPQKFINKLQIAIKNKEKRKKNKANCELSTRELDALKLIAEDLSNQEIADQLYISLNTVRTHVSHILLKLDATKRTQAVDKAKQLGII